MTDHLKLTAYFGERLRHESRVLSDELLDRCADASVTISVVLRGTAGFGPRHQLRSDQSLSGSEDLPVVIAAVDTADKITALGQQAIELTARGLITLERVRVLDTLAPGLTGATKLTIYLLRRQQVTGRPAYRAVCDLLAKHGFDSAAVFLGVDGTVGGERRRARFFGANSSVPVMMVAVGTGERVNAALPVLRRLLPDSLITVERAQLCKREGRLIAPPAALPATDRDGRPLWQKLMIYSSEADLHDGEPIHREIVRRLRADRSARGVSVLRGIWGFHGDRDPHGDRLIQFGRDVPVTTIIADSHEQIIRDFATIDEVTAKHGIVTCELVPALVSIDRGHSIGNSTLAHFE